MEQPLISLLMPCYNEETLVERAIKSVFEQTYENYELIIIDDASKDNTSNILSRYCDHEQVIIIRNTENRGVAESLNRGIKVAKGKYIARLDADDIMYENRLEKQVDFMQKNPEYILVGSYSNIVYPDGSVEDVKPPIKDEDIKWSLRNQNTFVHSSIMFKRVIDNKRIFYVSKTYEDYDLWIRLSTKGKFYNVDEILVSRYEDNNFYNKKTYDWANKKKSLAYLNIIKCQRLAAEKMGWNIFSILSIFKTSCKYLISRIREVFYEKAKIS